VFVVMTLVAPAPGDCRPVLLAFDRLMLFSDLI
jgi:hypothetical protein